MLPLIVGPIPDQVLNLVMRHEVIELYLIELNYRGYILRISGGNVEVDAEVDEEINALI
jgi:hypothetical protein